MPAPRVLVIEDDRSLTDILQYNLTQAGYQVATACDGQDGLNQIWRKIPDIVILDVMLPVIDGLEVCRRLRAEPETKNLLILMLTAKSEETDEIVGFSVGADDYVAKPFSVKVLLERLRALRRRRLSTPDAEDVISSQGVVVDRRRHKVTVESEPVELTPSEFRLLETLIRQPGRAFDRSELIDSALGEDTLVMERTIDVHIRALRRKLGPASDLIQTVRGVGYRFREEGAD